MWEFRTHVLECSSLFFSDISLRRCSVKTVTQIFENVLAVNEELNGVFKEVLKPSNKFYMSWCLVDHSDGLCGLFERP